LSVAWPIVCASQTAKLISIFLGFLFVVCVYLEELLVIARFIVLLLAGDMDGADLDLDAALVYAPELQALEAMLDVPSFFSGGSTR
jgi:hypothetical protein